MADILIEDPVPGVRLITLNRPDALNSLNHPMYEELLRIFEQLRNDLSIRAVILTGAGKAFSAGHDSRQPSRSSVAPEDYGRFQRNTLSMGNVGRLIPAMKAMPQPIIAAVKGAVAGLGYTLALASDMVIAGASTKFVNAFHNAGTGCEGGLSWLLPRAVGTQKAAEILFTGRPVFAEEAVRVGMALTTLPDDEIVAAAVALAEDIARNTPFDIMLTKQSLWHNMEGVSLEHAIAFESRAIHLSQATEDAAEKKRAFFEKRAPNFNNT